MVRFTNSIEPDCCGTAFVNDQDEVMDLCNTHTANELWSHEFTRRPRAIPPHLDMEAPRTHAESSALPRQSLADQEYTLGASPSPNRHQRTMRKPLHS